MFLTDICPNCQKDRKLPVGLTAQARQPAMRQANAAPPSMWKRPGFLKLVVLSALHKGLVTGGMLAGMCLLAMGVFGIATNTVLRTPVRGAAILFGFGFLIGTVGFIVAVLIGTIVPADEPEQNPPKNEKEEP